MQNLKSSITIMPQIGRQSIDHQSVGADFKYTLAIMCPAALATLSTSKGGDITSSLASHPDNVEHSTNIIKK